VDQRLDIQQQRIEEHAQTKVSRKIPHRWREWRCSTRS
jgi:hypothetical protein